MPDENSTWTVQSTQSSTQSWDDYVLDFWDLWDNNWAWNGNVKVWWSDDNDITNNSSNDLWLEEWNLEKKSINNEEFPDESNVTDNENIEDSQSDFDFSLNLDWNNNSSSAEEQIEAENNLWDSEEENSNDVELAENSQELFQEEQPNNSEDFLQDSDLFESPVDESNLGSMDSSSNADSMQDDYTLDNNDLQSDGENIVDNNAQEENNGSEFNENSEEENIFRDSNEETINNSTYDVVWESDNLDNNDENSSYDNDNSFQTNDIVNNYKSESSSEEISQTEEWLESTEDNFFKSEFNEESEWIKFEWDGQEFIEPTENEINLSGDTNNVFDNSNVTDSENLEENEDNNLFNTPQPIESETSSLESSVWWEDNYQIDNEDSQDNNYFSEDTWYDNENKTENDENTNNFETEVTPLWNTELNPDVSENNLQDTSNAFNQEYENTETMNWRNESLDSMVGESLLNEKEWQQVVETPNSSEEYTANDNLIINNSESLINHPNNSQEQDVQSQNSNNISDSELQVTEAVNWNSENTEKVLPQFNIQNETMQPQVDNVEVKSTLSLDQILDSEISWNTGTINNANTTPQHIQNSWWFSNKKLVTAVICVWVFSILWVLAYMELPWLIWEKEPLDTWSVEWVVYEEEGISAWEDLLENHPSAVEEDSQGEEQESEDIDKPTSNNPLPFIFPDAEIEEDEDYRNEENQWDSPVPYQQEEQIEEEYGNDDLLEDIEISISSFKSQGETYYSAWQEMLDKQMIKYSLQLINLCEKYQQQVENWEGVDQQSFSSFKTSANQIVSKINAYNNWWEEIEVIQANLDDSSYFEGKDELKDYIYNR